MLKIKCPNTFFSERKYIIDYFFDYTFDIDYIIEPKIDDGFYEIFYQDNTILVEDAFFSNIDEKKGYLYLRYLPVKPLIVNISQKQNKNISLIFGKPYFEETKYRIKTGYDIFASAFFMLSRWEENVLTDRDKHNRLPETQMFVVKNNIYNRPLVDEYAAFLLHLLQKINFKSPIKKTAFSITPTHDIDFFSRYSSLLKFAKALGGDLIKRHSIGQFASTTKRFMQIKTHTNKDPYNTFGFLQQLAEQNNQKAVFYFLAQKPGTVDYRYDIENNNLQKTIRNIVDNGHYIGLHGSYNSYNNHQILNNELGMIKKITPDIHSIRQHFLRFSVPQTWKIYNNIGITQSSSMGFSTLCGFRSGTCKSYPVFDIQNRIVLKINEHPLIVMDEAAKKSTSSVDKFWKKINQLKQIVRQYNGNFVFLWHNNNFELEEWKEYAHNYPEIYKT